MARVRDIAPAELPAEARAVYERFVAAMALPQPGGGLRPFAPAVTHLMGLLLELRQSGTVGGAISSSRSSPSPSSTSAITASPITSRC